MRIHMVSKFLAGLLNSMYVGCFLEASTSYFHRPHHISHLTIRNSLYIHTAFHHILISLHLRQYKSVALHCSIVYDDA